MSESGERPALYYPYIHIRSEHWLKATLLCVPSVKRIVPEAYTPEDPPSILKYSQITGPNGALLQPVLASSAGANEAQRRLLVSLRDHEQEIEGQYQRVSVRGPDKYWLHAAKFNDEVLHYLVERGLAWHSDNPSGYGHRTWYALHPVLGSAIMTTLGLSIAREECYDIVTESTKFHETLLATKEDAVFDALLNRNQPTVGPTREQVRHDLGQFVISLSGVNYEALRPEDIPELQGSKHFGKFQHLIRETVQRIDREEAPEEYEAQLKSAASDIIEAWHNTKSDLSRDIRDALFDGAKLLSGEALNAALGTGRGLHPLTIVGGLAVGLLYKRGKRFIESRQATSPYHYLTQIRKAENESLRLTFPLGLER